MDFTASNVFFFIVSLAMVLIAGAVVIGVYFLLGIVKDAQQLIQSLRMEVENFQAKRRGFEVNGRTVFKVAKLLLSWLVLRKK
jgi:hypothetical protein